MRNVLKTTLITLGSRIEQKGNRKGRFRNDPKVSGLTSWVDGIAQNSYEMHEVSYNRSVEFYVEYVEFKVCVQVLCSSGGVQKAAQQLPGSRKTKGNQIFISLLYKPFTEITYVREIDIFINNYTDRDLIHPY